MTVRVEKDRALTLTRRTEPRPKQTSLGRDTPDPLAMPG